jgi:hypothetical protein
VRDPRGLLGRSRLPAGACNCRLSCSTRRLTVQPTWTDIGYEMSTTGLSPEGRSPVQRISMSVAARKSGDDARIWMVFVDESDAGGWQNGTKVEMVVQVEERTVNDETSGGWLKALSVRTISG